MYYYTVPIIITCDNNKEIKNISEIYIPEDHPLVIEFQLPSRYYFFYEFLPENQRKNHDVLIKNAVKNFFDYYEDNPIHQYRKINLNPLLFEQSLQKYHIYIHLKFHEHKVINNDTQEFHFDIALIPETLYAKYQEYLYQCIIESMHAVDVLQEQHNINTDKYIIQSKEDHYKQITFIALSNEIKRLLTCIKVSHNFMQVNKQQNKNISLQQNIENIVVLLIILKAESFKIENTINNNIIIINAILYDKKAIVLTCKYNIAELMVNEQEMATNILLSALHNLLDNAINYANNKITLNIDLINNGEININIYDDGVQCNQQVFSPVKKKSADLSKKTTWENSWQLGLLTTKQLLKIYNGNIQVIPDNIGKTFSLQINKKYLIHDTAPQILQQNNNFFQPKTTNIIECQQYILAYMLHSIKNLLIPLSKTNFNNYLQFIERLKKSLQNIFKHPIYNQNSQKIQHIKLYNAVISKALNRNILRVAIIDDDPYALNCNKQVLNNIIQDIQNLFNPNLIIDIQTFQHPKLILEYFTKNPDAIDIIITDLNLGMEMNGIALIQEIIAKYPEHLIIKILCSADKICKIPNNIDEIFDKPLSTKVLLSFFKEIAQKYNIKNISNNQQIINLTQVETIDIEIAEQIDQEQIKQLQQEIIPQNPSCCNFTQLSCRIF